MVRYPYMMQKANGATVLTDEATGYSEPIPAAWADVSACRDEANGAGNEVSGVDGSVTVFKSQVFLPYGTEEIQAGTLIRILNGETLRLQGTVQRFERLQTHVRLWV